MKPFENCPTPGLRRLTRGLLSCAAALALTAGVGPVLADVTEIASAPLFTTTTTKVKPNIMFILDDSGSMASDYMPDDANNFQLRPNASSGAKYGKRTQQCNGLAYNPDSAKAPYDLAVDSTGTAKAQGSMNFLNAGDPVNQTDNPQDINSVTVVASGPLTVTVTSGSRAAGWYFVGQVVTVYKKASSSPYMVAKVTGWNAGTGALSLDVAMSKGTGSATVVAEGAPANQVYYTYSGTQTPNTYLYPGGTLNTGTTFYQECNSVLGASPGYGVFTAHIVTPGSTEAQRYANWYAYYSNRMAMMKTSVSRAFQTLDDKFRVGYTTISETSVTPGTEFLNVSDFNAAQKTSFYTNLFSAAPGGSTPLRGALSKIGRYYANKASGQTYDPVQYSCQKNFTILSTDGYWNTALETATYGPLAMDGVTKVGQMDGGATLRPMYDGGVTTATTTETWVRTDNWERTTATPKNTTGTSTVTVTVKTPTKGWTRTTYALTKTSYSTINNTTVSACTSLSNGECLISVTTSSNHGYATNNTITISGTNPAVYSGAFPITVTGAKTYTYKLTGLTSVPGTITSKGVSGPSASGCPSGQGKQVETIQTQDDQAIVATTTKTTTVTPVSISTVVERMTTTTPMTRKVIVVNGVQSSDTTTAGTTSTPVATPISGPTLTPATDPPVSTAGTPSVANSTATTAWANGASTTQTTCSSSVSSPTGRTQVAPTTAPTTSSSTPVTTGPTNVNGTPIVSNTTPTSTESTHASGTSTTNSGGSSDTLADVAMYYYQTDLRTDTLGNCTGALGVSVCANEVTALGNDNAIWQHMSTFTLSLGMSGTLQYDPSYASNPTGDYLAILQGTKNWPAPAADQVTAIDDLWHAAVNGRGQYFSATNPTNLIASLNAALVSISASIGSSSAAATSTLQPVEGNNGVYIAQFRSSEWTGDLLAYSIDIKTGVITTSKLDSQGNRVSLADWSAATQLTASTVRKIYYMNSGVRADFVYSSMPASVKANFDNACTKTAILSQCTGASDAAKATLNSGSGMVDFLRGQPHTEYRTRAQVLGDIVNSSPVFVGVPSFAYTENAFVDFAKAKKGRGDTLYVGANDGMLHAFNAANGQERWAYIPSMVMPNMYKLGDQFYESKHQYFVDATPVVGDIFVDGAWKTILVGGLNAGGRGYYALDVTDPSNPLPLWEFTDDNLGLSYGNPVITKKADGTWIVVFGSGYNNVSPGTGRGYLYVLNANTGAVIKQIDTGAGSTSNPSGLSRINPWIESDKENLAKRFYAGDLLGNVWRFDIDNLVEPKGAAFKLATLMVGGTPQPITVAPQVAEVKYAGQSIPVVYIGTGRYLGKGDVTSKAQQSIYAIKDMLGATGLGDVRNNDTLQKQKITATEVRKTVKSDTPMDWINKNGWYVDLLTSGERVNVEMQLAFDTLTAAGNVPGSAATDCSDVTSGKSWIYQLNIATGEGAADFITSMVAGLSIVQLGGPGGPGRTIITKTDASQPETREMSQSGTPLSSARRSSWRELVD